MGTDADADPSVDSDFVYGWVCGVSESDTADRYNLQVQQMRVDDDLNTSYAQYDGEGNFIDVLDMD